MVEISLSRLRIYHTFNSILWPNQDGIPLILDMMASLLGRCPRAHDLIRYAVSMTVALLVLAQAALHQEIFPLFTTKASRTAGIHQYRVRGGIG
jgi:hypothetical protein